MTRIVLDPNELNRVAGYITEAAVSYSEIASSLQQRDLPEMPETLTAAVGAGLTRVAERLDDLGGRLDASAHLLRTRAAVVDGDASAEFLLGLGRDLND